MPHKFNPKHKNKLDSEKRKQSFRPYETLKKLLLDEGHDMADIGCGTGFFSIPAAEIIGGDNIVYASDISDEMIETLKGKIENNNITNIKLIKGSEYNSPIGDVDYILLSNIFHEVKDKDEFLDNYLQKLRPDGFISFIEWKKIDTEEGPPFKDRVSIENLKEILEEKNLESLITIDITETHYGLVAKRI